MNSYFTIFLRSAVFSRTLATRISIRTLQFSGKDSRTIQRGTNACLKLGKGSPLLSLQSTSVAPNYDAESYLEYRDHLIFSRYRRNLSRSNSQLMVLRVHVSEILISFRAFLVQLGYSRFILMLKVLISPQPPFQ